MATDTSCRVEADGSLLMLRSPASALQLQTSRELTARSWRNSLTGRVLSLGEGPEVEIDLDAADARIPILGWRLKRMTSGPVAPDHEEGLRSGFAETYCDDSDWQGMATPVFDYETETQPDRDYRWARTHVFVPADVKGKPIALVLGGVGLHDFQHMRVFLNGHEVGVRRATARWHEPGVFSLGEGTPADSFLLYGRDNVIAVQLAGLVTRTRRLNEIDPQKSRWLVGKHYWPGQFEQYLVVGTPVRTPRLRVADVSSDSDGTSATLTVALRASRPSIEAIVTYRWNATEPVLRKQVEVRNAGRTPVRLMNLRLGRYATDAEVSEGEQGFPVYADGQFFLTLAHPSGWVVGQDGAVTLKQYPGAMLQPGESFTSMEAVLGVAQEGEARHAFLKHVRSLMRRTRRGHDRAYAFFESFGAWSPEEWWGVSTDYLLHQIRDVVVPEQTLGCAYDAYLIELWQDLQGDAARPNPKGFPNGFAPVVEELRRIGVPIAFWQCTSASKWSIGGNPVTGDCYTHNHAYGNSYPWFCLAAEPLKSMHDSAWRRLVDEHGARVLKLDGTSAICHNPNHGHLPGIYSTEAIQNALIDSFEQLDQTCPEVFLMLYWGCRSPWWLQYADTLFEPGLQIEAASPAASPALYVRDSVTVGLDQAQRWAEDIPSLGKDSLGVWLSDWSWNSFIGKERWQEGFVMDICRGSLLAQPWSDDGSLSEEERHQLGTFIQLLKARPDCFGTPRVILDDPWKHEPYGYSCANGERAFFAINNCTWEDRAIELQLNPAWGLSEGGRWDLYRWYPRPAKLRGQDAAFGETARLALRPFEVVLLEVVPTGSRSSLAREFRAEQIAATFDEPTRELATAVRPGGADLALLIEEGKDEEALAKLDPKRSETVSCQVPPSRRGGLLAVTAEVRPYGAFAARVRFSGAEVEAAPVLPRCSISSWQGWRVAMDPSSEPRDVEVAASVRAAADASVTWHAYFIPADQ